MRVASGDRAALLRPGLLRALVLGASSWRLARIAQDREHGATGARHPAACRCQDWVASFHMWRARRMEAGAAEHEGWRRSACCGLHLQSATAELSFTKTTRQVGKVISFITCCLYNCPANSRFRLEAQLIMVKLTISYCNL